MQRLSEPRARPRIRRALAIAAALLCATAPNLTYAGPHGGGGGGGFHGGGMAADLADFTVTSRVCTMVSAIGARVFAIGAGFSSAV